MLYSLETGASIAPVNNRGSSSFEHSILITAAPTRVMAAFFDPETLAAWWQTIRSVTTPRVLGVYAVEWPPIPDEDEILGPVGGVFYGTVVDYKPGKELFLGEAWWLPPNGEPLGPMALEIRCAMDGPACRLTVRQSGFDEGPRWERYYTVISNGWKGSLARLKTLLEGA